MAGAGFIEGEYVQIDLEEIQLLAERPVRAEQEGLTSPHVCVIESSQKKRNRTYYYYYYYYYYYSRYTVFID